MYFPANASIGKMVDMICSWAKLDLIDRSTQNRLRVYSMVSGHVLPMSSQLRQLVQSGQLVEHAPIMFDYGAEDEQGMREETVRQLNRLLTVSIRQTLAKKCGATIKVLDHGGTSSNRASTTSVR